MAKRHTEEQRKLDDTCKEISQLVVGVLPSMNEQVIRGKLYDFFEAESEYSNGIYDDTNIYDAEEVIRILETAFDPGNGDEASMVATSDFRWAFDQLSDGHRYRIQERFQHGIVRPHGSKERQQLYKAIYRLTDILNRWNRRRDWEGTGSRKIWSNARAQAEVQADYSGSRDEWGDPWGRSR